MQRWHRVRNGRIVASCECATGDAAEVLLHLDERNAEGQYNGGGLIVSDAQWREKMYRKALFRVGVPKRVAEHRTADMRRRANELQARKT